ncbi:hypothetical protein [Arthrobacter bambusae]|uniref:hypothetical protein n=1 Tax=Arthrobacter bambusae TaxID=1338426 RepID=UPI002783AE9C|nr:hypothetical protein [Arthrobacter bambusae]MDQ0029991.1 MFS family permease [Arthrobacter bambusae]MDQ0097491.1 MFS family permease [Arthrobacter bambusae]
MRRFARRVLRWYPPSFRARYGDELDELVDSLPGSARTTADLLWGAVRAWVRPVFPGADGLRRRLLASVSTTWIAWCAGFLVAPAANKALLDPPGAGAGMTVRILLYCGLGLFTVGWLLALAAAIFLLIRAVLPVTRSRAWFALKPLLPAVVLGVIEAAVMLALVLMSQSNAVAETPTIASAVLIGWLVGLAAFLGCLGIGAAVSLQRLEIGASTLQLPALLAVPLALVLATMSVCDIAAVILAGDAALFGSVVPVIVVLAVAGTASVAALTSSARGIPAIRHA